MLTILYILAWILLVVVLEKMGFGIASIEFWIIIGIYFLLSQIKNRLYEKMFNEIMEKFKNGA